MYMSDDNKPIGYWVRLLDRLIEETFQRVLAAEGLTRRDWQVLTALGGGADPRTELAPFWTHRDEADEVLAELAGRGWVRLGDPPQLTTAGQAAHTDLQRRVGAARRIVADGFTAEQYRAVVDGLRRMATNLERAAS